MDRTAVLSLIKELSDDSKIMVLGVVDDATVAVQLEPTLIKAIKKGGCFRHKPSTFYSLISSKEDFVVCGR